MYIGFNNTIKKKDHIPWDLADHLVELPPIFYYELFVAQSVVPLWNYHREYFLLVANKLDLLLPDFFVNYEKFLTRLVNRNKFFNGAVVKILFYPWEDTLNFIAIPKKVLYNSFMLNDEKLIILSKKELKCFDQDNNWSFLWDRSLHNYIYRNENFISVYKGKVYSSKNFAILAKKKNVIFSPTYHCGFKYNALQIVINEFLEKQNFDLRDEPIEIDFLQDADEVWLIDNVYGIYHRLGWENYRYWTSDLAQQCVDYVNKLAFR